MTNFNDSEYANMIAELINDTNYVKVSNRSKIAHLRTHTEVMVRKILDIGSDTYLLLGNVRENSKNDAVNNGMKKLGNELSCKLIEIIQKIRLLGNEGHHTKHTESFSDEEVGKVEDAFLDLYAFIFIKYFMDIQVSIYSSPQVLSEFSFLPPIIRYKTWSYLYEKDKNNIQVVNRLCLSIIKTYDKEKAYKWLEDNSEVIRAIPYPTDSDIEKYIQTCGVEVKPGSYMVSLNFYKYNNIYDLLYDKISNINTSINESGKMYSNFEEAIKYYNKNKQNFIRDDAPTEVKKFHSLMEFVFIGRKSKEELKA